MDQSQFHNLPQGYRLAIGTGNILLAVACLILLAFVIMMLLFTLGAHNWNESYRGGAILMGTSVFWLLCSIGLFLTTAVIAFWKRRWSLLIQLMPVALAVVLYVLLIIVSKFLL
jgi:membrane-associated HD superfamily phosphohydrolase